MSCVWLHWGDLICWPCRVDLRDVKVVTKLGSTVDDSEMIDGMIFDHKPSKVCPSWARLALLRLPRLLAAGTSAHQQPGARVPLRRQGLDTDQPPTMLTSL